MRLKLSQHLAILAFVFTVNFGAHAASITFDGDVIGWKDNLDQDWLRLDLPDLQSKTFTDYLAGVNYAGQNWRLAGVNEILTLWNEFAPYVHDSGIGITAHYETAAPEALALRAVFGTTFAARTGGRTWTRGYSSDYSTDINGDIINIRSPHLYLDYSGMSGGISYYSEEFWVTQTYGAESFNWDAWLVSTAPVPLPPALLLFSFGLFGLARFSKKRTPEAS